jgi:hypothetical protein
LVAGTLVVAPCVGLGVWGVSRGAQESCLRPVTAAYTSCALLVGVASVAALLALIVLRERLWRVYTGRSAPWRVEPAAGGDRDAPWRVSRAACDEAGVLCRSYAVGPRTSTPFRTAEEGTRERVVAYRLPLDERVAAGALRRALVSVVLYGFGSALCAGAGALIATRVGRSFCASRVRPEAPEVRDVERVFAVGEETCALRSNGALVCWGADAQAPVRERPIEAELRPGTQVVGGILGVCYPSEANAALMCRPSSGASNTHGPSAWKPALAGTFRLVRMSSTCTCAVDALGALRCWGAAPPPLGAGDALNPVRFDPSIEPGEGLVGPSSRAYVHDVAVGVGHVCAVHGPERALRCWGSNEYGQLGHPWSDTTPEASREVMTRVRQVVAGGFFTCALREAPDWGVYCWGANEANQCGPTTRPRVLPPAGVVVDPAVIELAAGYNTVYARTSDGRVLSWGFAGDERLGREVGRGHCAAVDGIHDAVELSAGWNHACVRTRSRAVRCWGSNDRGQVSARGPRGGARLTLVTGLTRAE